MDGLKRAGTPTWVVGVLALVLAVFFGAVMGAPNTHSGATHQLLSTGHHGSWSGGEDDQHPFMLHAEGEQVETPDAAGHDLAPVITSTTPLPAVSALVERFTRARPALPPVRAVLQIWRT